MLEILFVVLLVLILLIKPEIIINYSVKCTNAQKKSISYVKILYKIFFLAIGIGKLGTFQILLRQGHTTDDTRLNCTPLDSTSHLILVFFVNNNIFYFQTSFKVRQERYIHLINLFQIIVLR